VDGDGPDHIFNIEIAANKKISALKKAIMNEKRHAFRNVDADDLKLWKVRACYGDS
jgi:hypothetical protein